jgi:hypothetical protein
MLKNEIARWDGWNPGFIVTRIEKKVEHRVCSVLAVIRVTNQNESYPLSRFLTDQVLSSKNLVGKWWGYRSQLSASTVIPVYEQTAGVKGQHGKLNFSANGSTGECSRVQRPGTITSAMVTGQVVPPEGRISRREQGQKSNHCRIASLTFQGQDNKCKTMKFQGQEYLQSKMLLW